ncbi:MAG: glycosyltransferase [Chitinophagaceae bacterium]
MHLLDLSIMLFTLIVAAILFTGYSLLIFIYWRNWNAVPVFIPLGEPVTSISIIIPVRNEALNIGNLLTAILAQQYPGGKLEIIVVDDHSEDGTVDIVKTFPRVKLIHLPDQQINSFKKKSIETGIAVASGELIITTDADCIPGHDWLSTMALFYQNTSPVFIAAPVVINHGRTIIGLFQSMDFLVLQGITAASVQGKIHAMCNGANMAYRRDVFYEVEGFRGIDHIASGDDMLLLYKIRQRYPERIGYLRSAKAIMATSAQPTIGSFFNQRIRWASKATVYQEKNMLPVLALVYCFNLLFPVLLVAAYWFPQLWLLLLLLLLGKTLVEFPFYWSVAGFYKLRGTAWLFPLFQPAHILYTVLSGFLGQIHTYEWKGRKVS